MNTEDLAGATEEGVSAPTLTSQDSPRMRNLDAIAATRLAQLSEETGLEAAPVEEGLTPESQVAAQLEAQPAAPVEKVRVKVDGTELEVSQEELVRTFQKNAAADKRLEEATRLLREAEQLVATRTAASAPQEAQPQPATTEDPVTRLREDAAATLAKLYDGDQEAATEALVALMLKVSGGGQPTQQTPAIDPSALTDQVLEQLSFKDALSKVQTDYPDLVTDPNLERLTAMRAEELIAAGKTRADALLEAADGLYQSLGKVPTGRQPAPAEAPKTTRQANKERLDPIPTAHASAMPPAAPVEANPSTVIAELAKNRLGQSSAL